MVLYIKNYNKGLDDYFICSFVPSMIKNYLIHSIESTKNTRKLDVYLQSQFGITTKEVILDVCCNLKTTWVGTSCKIAIDSNVYNKKSNEKVKSLMKLIEYGNSSVKGLGIFREALKYCEKYINLAYRLYLQRGAYNYGN